MKVAAERRIPRNDIGEMEDGRWRMVLLCCWLLVHHHKNVQVPPCFTKLFASSHSLIISMY